jgi:hypothetical protein
MFETLSNINNLFVAGHVNWPAFFAAAAWAGGAMAAMAAARYRADANRFGAAFSVACDDLDDAESEIAELSAAVETASRLIHEHQERITHLLQVVDECHRDYDALARGHVTA